MSEPFIEHARAVWNNEPSLCIDAGDGTCRDCHVGLDECDACGGIGYHHKECPQVDELRADIEATFAKSETRLTE